MEIRRMVRGENINFSAASPRTGEGKTKQPAAAPSTDRLELSRQWIQSMEEQRAQAGAALLTGAREEKKSNSILDMLDGPSAEQEELDALSQELDTQMKCLKIAMLQAGPGHAQAAEEGREGVRERPEGRGQGEELRDLRLRRGRPDRGRRSGLRRRRG